MSQLDTLADWVDHAAPGKITLSDAAKALLRRTPIGIHMDEHQSGHLAMQYALWNAVNELVAEARKKTRETGGEDDPIVDTENQLTFSEETADKIPHAPEHLQDLLLHTMRLHSTLREMEEFLGEGPASPGKQAIERALPTAFNRDFEAHLDSIEAKQREWQKDMNDFVWGRKTALTDEVKGLLASAQEIAGKAAELASKATISMKPRVAVGR